MTLILHVDAFLVKQTVQCFIYFSIWQREAVEFGKRVGMAVGQMR